VAQKLTNLGNLNVALRTSYMLIRLGKYAGKVVESLDIEA